MFTKRFQRNNFSALHQSTLFPAQFKHWARSSRQSPVSGHSSNIVLFSTLRSLSRPGISFLSVKAAFLVYIGLPQWSFFNVRIVKAHNTKFLSYYKYFALLVQQFAFRVDETTLRCRVSRGLCLCVCARVGFLSLHFSMTTLVFPPGI